MKTIKGYLQEMPNLHYTPTGKVVTILRIADNPIEDNIYNFKTVIAWEELALLSEQVLSDSPDYIYKGLVYFTGYWQTKEWGRADGSIMPITQFVSKQIFILSNGQLVDIETIL